LYGRHQRPKSPASRTTPKWSSKPPNGGLVNYVDGIALSFVEAPAVRFGEGRDIGIVSQSGGDGGRARHDADGEGTSDLHVGVDRQRGGNKG
jgi:hypothetical protein